MGDFYNYGYGNMFSFGWIFVIIFWGLVIWGVFALIKNTTHSDKDGINDKNKALAILNERYAKSEISKEEFEEKKNDLQN